MSTLNFCGTLSTELEPGGITKAKEQTFAHHDGSWPCLKNIKVADGETLHYIVPSTYFETDTASTHHMSLQSIPLEDRVKSTQTIGFPTYTLFTGTTAVHTILAQQNVVYEAEYPLLQSNADLGLGSTCYQVDSCADTSYNPPSLLKWYAFSFTATVPASLYSKYVEINREIVTTTDSENCVLNATVECLSNAKDTPGTTGTDSSGNPNMYGVNDYKGCLDQTMTQNNSNLNTTFSRSKCLCADAYADLFDLYNVSCTSGVTNFGETTYGSQKDCDSGDSGDANDDFEKAGDVSRSFVSANFRDGYQRLQAENVTTNSDGDVILPFYSDSGSGSACWESSLGSDAGQLYTGYSKQRTSLTNNNNNDLEGRRNVPDQITFSNSNTCFGAPDSMQDQNALVLMDVASGSAQNSASLSPLSMAQEPNRKVFVNLKWKTDNASNVSMPTFAQMNGEYIQSFNVAARMPTCLTSLDVTPTSDTARYNSDYKVQDCYDIENEYSSWKWTKNKDLGFSSGSYYGGSDEAYNLDTHSNWPSASKPVDTDHPDIVIRIAFYNKYLVNPATGVPVALKVANDDLETNLVQLFALNSTVSSPSKDTALDQCILYSDHYTILFYEYMAAILYRSLYNVFLTTDGQGNSLDRWFSVSSNLIRGSDYAPYDAQNFFKDYLTTFLSSYTEEPNSTSSTIQDKLHDLSTGLVEQANDYFRYPQIRYDANTREFYVEFYCDLYTHLTLLNQQGTASIQQYLRNLFQDAQNAIIQAGSSTVMAPGNPTEAPEIVLKDTGVHDPTSNLVWKGDDLEFVTSYYWRQNVESMSPTFMIYLGIMGAQDSLPDWLAGWYDTISWDQTFIKIWVPGVPQLVRPTDSSANNAFSFCLNKNPLTEECAQVLCTSTENCLCDYSITLNSITLNPASSIYFNNSNGACACLANQSYPLGANDNQRALNPVTLCFSKACQEYGYNGNVDCGRTGCTSFESAVTGASKSVADGTWMDVFGSQGIYLDSEELQNTCGLQLTTIQTTAKQTFYWNWYALSASIALALTVPLYVGTDAIVHKTNRGPLFYALCGGLCALCCGVGILLTYMFSGKFSCYNPETKKQEYTYSNTQTGRCTDRLLESIPLSVDVCYDASPVFCQCATEGDACGGDYNGKGQCAANHMCCVCPNSCLTSEVDVSFNTLGSTVNFSNPFVLSSNLIYVGVAAFLLFASVIVVLVPHWVGRGTEVWTGKHITRVNPRSKTIQWGVTGGILLIVLAGIGVGVYYGSQIMPIQIHAIDKTVQTTDLNSTQACL